MPCILASPCRYRCLLPISWVWIMYYRYVHTALAHHFEDRIYCVGVAVFHSVYLFARQSRHSIDLGRKQRAKAQPIKMKKYPPACWSDEKQFRTLRLNRKVDWWEDYEEDWEVKPHFYNLILVSNDDEECLGIAIVEAVICATGSEHRVAFDQLYTRCR